MKTILSLALYSTLMWASANSAYAQPAPLQQTPIETLSPELRSLLQQEMSAIENGMKGIISAYISGDLKTIGEIAGRLESSFILKQKITEAQKQELHQKLPKQFIDKDKQSHKIARKIEQASLENNMELVGIYYSKLLGSCVSCHSEFATHRFPELINTRPNKEDYYY